MAARSPVHPVDGRSIGEETCGTPYRELWTCPVGHTKPKRCTLSVRSNSFCCPLTPPAECFAYCAKASLCNPERAPICEDMCATDLKFIEELDDRAMCRAKATEYFECIGQASKVACRDALPISAACDKLGEASIACQTEGHFVRSPASDATCASKGLPSLGYTAMDYGFARNCRSFDDDKTFSDGELKCCSYP